MVFLAVAERGGSSTPFQLAGKPPIEREPVDQRLWGYSGGHLGFYGFLRVADARISRRALVGLMDLPDRCWRDAYEDGAHPSAEADEALAEEGCEA